MRHLLSSSIVVVMLALGFSSTVAAQQPRDVPPQSVDTVDDDRRDGTDWGWLGLVGLVGLMGMKPRESHDRPVVRTDAHPSTAR